MITVNDNCIYVDCDDTLLIPYEDCFVPAVPNEKLIEKIREWSVTRDIIVWTSNPKGVDWCIEVCELCGITDIVKAVLPKPTTIVDDDHLEYYSIIDPITFERRYIHEKENNTGEV